MMHGTLMGLAGAILVAATAAAALAAGAAGAGEPLRLHPENPH